MKYNGEQLMGFCRDVMSKAGLGAGEAEVFARSLVVADMRGIASHGVTRLRTYSQRVKSGVVRAGAEPTVVSGSDGFLLIDANNGLGASVGLKVMDLLMDKAKVTGSCMASVRGGNHFGIGALFTMYAAQKGMIAFAMSNASACVVPTGGAKSMLGTNPLSIALPADRYGCLVLDMATSSVAQGKVILAQKEGKPIPSGWAVDDQGRDTTDPAAALKGSMLPFGGPKGYALGLIIDILCATLSGANSSRGIPSFWNDFENPQNLGFFMGVMDISRITSLDDFRSNTTALFDEIKSSPRAPGVDEIFIPGELEERAHSRAQQDGIELGAAVVADLKALGDEYGVSFFE